MLGYISGKTKSGTDVYSFKMSETEYHEFENENTGLCVYCGEETYGVEPDARKYVCESCEKPGVYGVPELLLMGRVHFIEDEE
mgnify:FL=1